MQYIIYLFFLLFVQLFRFIPFFLLYGVSDFLYLILYHIIGYRKKVVRQNLSKSFPEKSIKELRIIERKVYRNLTDVTIEGIKGFTMSQKEINKRFRFTNPEVINSLYDKNQSFIAVLGHYCNWEWGTISAGMLFSFNIVAFYKPLSNKYIDKYLKKSRGKSRTILSPIGRTFQTFEDFRDKPTIFVMVADQSPSNMKRAYWFNFLNQPTAWIHGPEKYSRLFDLPVYFINVERKKRGMYDVKIMEISGNPGEMPETKIISNFIRKLEKVIMERPENWLWSHKRWKIKFHDSYQLNN